MTQITARVPDDLARQIDETAAQLKRSRAQVVRQALEYCLEDFEDLKLGIERLRDPADSILDGDDVRRELLDQAQIAVMGCSAAGLLLHWKNPRLKARPPRLPPV